MTDHATSRRSLSWRCSAAASVALLTGCQAFAPDFAEFGAERVRDLRDRAAQQDTMLELRLDALLPESLEHAGIDCWLVVADGQDGDPMLSLLTARATRLEGKGALLLCAGNAPARIALGRGFSPNAAFYEVVEPPDGVPLEDLLNQKLGDIDPQRIAIDDARTFAAADGLTASNARWLRERLTPEFADRLVSSRPVVESFLATLLDVEAPLFAESARLTAAVLAEVLSDQVVVAAGTSLGDLEWAVRERAALLDVELAYPPRTFVYRPGESLELERSMELDLILQPGDVVFLSAGISYLGYANRIGRWAYLLPSGTREAPPWVGAAMTGLADAAEELVGALDVGQTEAEVARRADAALAGLAQARVAVDRVGRLHEGALDPARVAVVSGAWHPEFALAADTGLAMTLESTVEPPGAGARAFSMLLVDTALVTATGAHFVMPLQRAPLLID